MTGGRRVGRAETRVAVAALALAVGAACSAESGPAVAHEEAASSGPAAAAAARPARNEAPVPNISRRDAVVRVVELVGPAVVNISTEVRVRNPYYDSLDLFERFFGRSGPRSPRSERYRVENSLGSGVIVDESGYVLTNDHVIAAASRITVTLADGRQVEAEVVGTDGNSDLAVLRLAGDDRWPAVPFGTSSDLMIGETVIAIGNPFGLQNTVTVGVVSGTGRTVGGQNRYATPYADFLQTDAAINPGNSGGALINVHGELVGINTLISARGQNLGFAIPVDRVRKVFDELVTHRRVRPSWTGVAVENVDADQAEAFGLADVRGVYVWKRHANSPAAEARIEAGDVILSVDGQRVANVAEFLTAVDSVSYGESVRLGMVRGGEEIETSLVVEAFPEERSEEFVRSILGVTLAEGRGGVYFESVRPSSYLGQRGLPEGWRLVEMNGREIESMDDVRGAMSELLYRRAAHLVVAGRRSAYRVTVPLD